MPNHVKNIVKMKGIANLPLFKEENNAGEIMPAFDFGKIIPMPESLNMDAGGIEDIAIEAVIRKVATTRYGFERRKAIPSMNDAEYQQRLVRSEKTEEELCELGLRYINNKVMYGATSWYDWCITNWGTKWNAYENKQLDADTIVFETAWNAPRPVIVKLARMYSGAEIEHWWADEDTGSNDGYAKYSGGETVEFVEYESCSHEAYATYVLCWGESECLYQDENGKWHHRDCDECHGCD